MEARISEAELIADLIAAQGSGAVDLRSGATTQEIMTIKGWSEKKARAWIKTQRQAGTLAPIRVWRERIDEVLTLVPAYKVVQDATG